ncbi:betaine-aldehyde dehydrogenase [Aerococcus urinaehominis]|uniref:aldehyde dehydrogenase (NAD(+)) n=1 Tax=Aerococcus urinaehominis TaxID=128944 RepID=A0A109RGU4_9LACT|nr:aldehyde dehydrogenase family protein [Aerococcus urinaehominis]AMB99261.1 betaine-aldehyde dehydrogenase [Aerococcus urinaehominis]SDM46904.1 aldehyde dehydrogenase (NAD+) [Aerococcus urinaehominis]
MRDYQLFIDNQWQDASSGEMIDVINPANEEVIGRVPKAGQADVDRAVAAAKKAFLPWSQLHVDQRISFLEKVEEGLAARQDEIAATIVAELGASKTFSCQRQAPMAIKESQATLDQARQYPFQEDLDNAVIRREGVGVVAAITPWNYPLNQIQRKLTPALVAGNTIVVKPASETPLTAMIYAEIIEEAGLPAGVFNLVTGSGSETGDYLAGHPDVDLISFTGSTEVGQGLYHKAASTVKQLVLELGGKSALIYLPGGDLQAAVKQAVDSCVNNSGQTCSALTRLLIPADEYDRTKQVVKDYIDTIQQGDPSDADTVIGPMVSKGQMETVLEYIDQGQAEGAELLTGGYRLERPGYFVAPTVFVEADNRMSIAQEEIFGPVLTILTYQDTEDAIKQANDSIYGLSGAVVGPEGPALEVAQAMRTGNVIINGASMPDHAPFGGYKQSGVGREKGRFGIDDYVEIKAVFK